MLTIISTKVCRNMTDPVVVLILIQNCAMIKKDLYLIKFVKQQKQDEKSCGALKRTKPNL